MSKILVVGSSNLDFVWRCPRLPLRGETVAGGAFATYTGGKGANQAVAAGRLGADVALCACVGDDMFGAQMREAVASAGVDVADVRSSGAPSGTAGILVEEDGANQIVVALGANLELSADDVRRAAARHAPQIVLAQCETRMEPVEASAGAAPVFILNPAPATDVPADIIRRCFAIIPNETEISRMTGIQDEALAAQRLLELGAQNVVVTLGSQGLAWYADGGLKMRIPAHVVEAVDTVAAGDVFCGAFATALAEGQDFEMCLRFASAASAISVTRHGAQSSCPLRGEVDHLMSPSLS